MAIAKLQKQIKELQARIQELQEECDSERQFRSKVRTSSLWRYDACHIDTVITNNLHSVKEGVIMFNELKGREKQE